MITYENGALHLLRPIAANSVVDITTALGATIARYKVTDANANTVRINRLGQGIYFVGITSGNAKTMQRLFVK